MIVISDHASRLFPAPPDAVIRVNLAWYTSREAAETAVLAIEHDVYLDFPDGRSKPPVPTITIEGALTIAARVNVKYFAVSNCESTKRINDIQGQLREGVVFVPKIETKKGVLNMDLMVLDCGIRMMMLDKEDLYIDLKRDGEAFTKFVDLARAKAKALGVELLELQGVIFA